MLLSANTLRIGIIAMIGAIVVLNLLDFVTTYIILEKMDGREVNPVLVYLMDITNTIWVILVVKLIGLSWVCGIAYRRWALCQRPLVFWTMLAVTIIYMIVVLWNSYVIINFWELYSEN